MCRAPLETRRSMAGHPPFQSNSAIRAGGLTPDPGMGRDLVDPGMGRDLVDPGP